MRRAALVCALAGLAGSALAQTASIEVGFLWHMHQPKYLPGQNPLQVDGTGQFSFSVTDVHNQRLGPYTTWPRDAVAKGTHLPNLGASVSISGSLIENLNALEAAGVNGGIWNNWKGPWRQSQSLRTSLNNPRLDLIGFAHHHALLPLIDPQAIRMQIRLHKEAYRRAWNNAPYPKGIFPPETAFATHIIPALAAEGIEWAIVDNIHFDRACVNYPHTDASNLYRPNPADQVNPDPAASGGAWIQLQNLWAPSRVSAPFGYQPHFVQHIDPATGQATRIIAVPGARYEGNEDGRGGYGAFLYDQVMDALLPYASPSDPLLVVLHHDGDNFGGGSQGYYDHNFQNMVNWDTADPDYNTTSIQDHLDRFPPAPGDIIHVEPGSWAGADNGDPEFKKWLGDPNNGVSPDINSWAAIVAATNRVLTADRISPSTSIAAVHDNTGSSTDRAWHFLLNAQASDYWYWDGTEVWDSNPTVGSNLATQFADQVIASYFGVEQEPPTVFHPQREPYNPGLDEFGTIQPRDFEVWSLVYDASGLSSVTLRYRLDNDGVNPLGTIENETYAGGPGVGAWQSIAMTASSVPTPAGVAIATHKAQRYSATIAGLSSTLVDYYIEAIDTEGNIQRSPIQHVFVGDGNGGQPGGGVEIDPAIILAGAPVTVRYTGALSARSAVNMHHGFNQWNPVVGDVPMALVDGAWQATISVPASATQLDLVFNDGANDWDNNNGQDWHFPVQGGTGGFVMDGSLDAAATPIATSADGTTTLFAALDGDTLYLATEAPSNGDRFILLAQQAGAPTSAMWAKAGTVAAWDAFLAAESDNGYSGWFDATGAQGQARGGHLEGLIGLAAEFGVVPDTIDLAVAVYQSPDGGALLPTRQAPPTLDGDTTLEAAEFVTVRLCELRDDCCPADLSSPGAPGVPDGALTGADFFQFLDLFTAGDLRADFSSPSAPGTPDGALTGADFFEFLGLFSGGC